jgi:hypothetical protein
MVIGQHKGYQKNSVPNKVHERKVGNRQHLSAKTEAGTFSCLFQIFGFTWPH